MAELDRERKSTAEKTRAVYLDQHNKYLTDEALLSRFVRMLKDIGYFHLEEGALRGKKVLDAGCGNSAYFQLAMHRFGVGKQVCLDLGDEWIDPLRRKLRELGVPEEETEFVPGSTDDLPFGDDSFDFVASNGVLVHLNDLKQVEKAFSHLARVVKPGGSLYLVLGVPSGLFEEEILPAVRRFYHRNAEFRTLIDNLMPEVIGSIFNSIGEELERHEGKRPDYRQFLSMIDVDFCVTLQNLIQVPKRLCLELDERWVLQHFAAAGFEPPKRCVRYVKRNNIRKHLAPLHFRRDWEISKIFYGPGNLEYVAKKLS